MKYTISKFTKEELKDLVYLSQHGCGKRVCSEKCMWLLQADNPCEERCSLTGLNVWFHRESKSKLGFSTSFYSTVSDLVQKTSKDLIRSLL